MEEAEARAKAEITRMKSKFQAEIEEIRLRYESLRKVKAEMENQMKKLQASLKDAQDHLIEEQNVHEATRELLNAAEKRNGIVNDLPCFYNEPFFSLLVAILRGEIEEIRVLLDRVSLFENREMCESDEFVLFRVKKLVKQRNSNYTIRNNA